MGHLIYSHQHLDDARIQQEIAKNLYRKEFGDCFVVHAHNGKEEFGYKKYLEDELIITENRGHFQGAVDLINAGLFYFDKHKKEGLKYVLVTAADTWCLDPKFIKKVIQEMEEKEQVVAVSSWMVDMYKKIKGFSTDFFIVDLEWNRKSKVWPLDYIGFKKKFIDIFALFYSQPFVEGAFQYAFQKHILNTYENNDTWRNRNKLVRRIIEREPIHKTGADGMTQVRQDDWPEIGLYTNPDGKTKKKALEKLGLELGEYSKKLVGSSDISYYNKV